MLVNKQAIAALFVIMLSISQATVASARTLDFEYYTFEVPDDWKDVSQSTGPHPVMAPDGRLLIAPVGATILNGAKPHADGSPDMDAIINFVEHTKKEMSENPAKWGVLMREFAAKDLGENRSLVRGVFRLSPSASITVYMVTGPTYAVTLITTSKHGIDDTLATLDPIFASLKWTGKRN